MSVDELVELDPVSVLFAVELVSVVVSVVVTGAVAGVTGAVGPGWASVAVWVIVGGGTGARTVGSVWVWVRPG